jgi:hypothetical protein
MFTVLEAVQAEHPHCPPPWPAWRRAPLDLLFVYYTAIGARWGNEAKGPTYVDRDQRRGFREDMERARQNRP